MVGGALAPAPGVGAGVPEGAPTEAQPAPVQGQVVGCLWLHKAFRVPPKAAAAAARPRGGGNKGRRASSGGSGTGAARSRRQSSGRAASGSGGSSAGGAPHTGSDVAPPSATAGAAFGIARGILAGVLFVLLVQQVLPEESVPEQMTDAFSYPYLDGAASWIRNTIPGFVEKAGEAIAEPVDSIAGSDE